MLQDLTTALQSASGQISHAPEDQPTTARKKRAGQIDLLITTAIQNRAVQIASQHHALTVHGNLAHQELIDHHLTDLTQSETHLTAEQEATTAQSDHRIAQHVRTLTVLGNHALQELIDHLLTETTQTDHQEPEATTDQTAPQTDQPDLTQTVHGNLVHQEPIAQSAQGIHVDLRLVQTLASLTATATRSARTAFREIAQEMKPLLALATRTQTRRLSSRTRF